MAWDHTLALECPEGVGILRLYSWDRPTLSLGRNEPASVACTEASLARTGVGLVRRPTGGRSVLHHRELTYAVVVPERALGGPREAYRLINSALAAGLSGLGLSVEVARDGVVLPPDAGPCFRSPAPGEVVAGSGKLVGSAQVRMGGTLLQHGSILIHNDQGLLVQLAGGDPEKEHDGGDPVALADLLPSPPARGELAAAIRHGFESTVPGDWRTGGGQGTLGPHELPSKPSPDLLEKYASREWTWRR